MIKVTGNPPAFPVEARTGYNKSSGRYIEYVYKGPRSAMEAKETELINSSRYDEVTRDKTSLIATVVARTNTPAIENPQEETPEIDVRMEVHRQYKHLIEHYAFNGMEAKYKDVLDSAQKSIDGNGPPLLPDQWPSEYLSAYSVYELSFRGVKTFPVYHPTLIVTATTSSAYVFNVAYDNVGRIVSTDYLANDAQIVGALRFNLPNFLSEDNRYVYGWLKHYPNYQVTSGNRYTLTQEFEYSLYPVVLYGGLVA